MSLGFLLPFVVMPTEATTLKALTARPFARNTFGHPLGSPQDLLADADVFELARDVLCHESDAIGCRPDLEQIADFLQQVGQQTDWSVQPEVRARFEELLGGDAGLSRVCTQRVNDILAVLQRFVVTEGLAPFGSVIDLGCGHGLVADGLRRQSPDLDSLLYADVLDYRDVSVCTNPFVLIPEHGRLPFKDRTFDTVLLITVLHHASNPVELLREAVRICRGRLHIIESLVGVTPVSRTISRPRGSRWERYFALESRFAAMTVRQQTYHAALQDWCYNELVQGGVNVPMNFGTDAQWSSLFSTLRLEVEARYLLGYDELTAPEYHALYVVRCPTLDSGEGG